MPLKAQDRKVIDMEDAEIIGKWAGMFKSGNPIFTEQNVKQMLILSREDERTKTERRVVEEIFKELEKFSYYGANIRSIRVSYLNKIKEKYGVLECDCNSCRKKKEKYLAKDSNAKTALSKCNISPEACKTCNGTGTVQGVDCDSCGGEADKPASKEVKKCR